MFRFAPAPRAGETLYSVLARLGRYLNASHSGPLMREMLGRRHAIAANDLPGRLAVLVRDLEESRRAQAGNMIIDKLTLYPFHTAFMPADVREDVRRAMLGDVMGVYTRLGLATFKIQRTKRLRFCPLCLDSMEQEHGDVWWRREHQIPGVLVCPHHGTVLRLSDVEPGDRNRHSFVPASRTVCRCDADEAVSAADGVDRERLTDLARLAAGLLNSPPLPRSHADSHALYRARLAQVGLMRSASKVDQVALRQAFLERWRETHLLVPGLRLHEDPEQSWLAALVRNGRRAAHPLHHLMLTAVLDGLAEVPVAQPFGPGPWPCRNPLAAHHGSAVIEVVSVRRDGASLYGDFACSCGYLYTIARLEDGRLGRPRYRRFGPLLPAAIKAAVERGDALRATARALGIDPKTLIREAKMAGMEVPWSTSPSGAVTELMASPRFSGAARQTRRSRPLRNWFAIDTRLAGSMKRAGSAIRSLQPPVRVTFAELERHVATKDWIMKRRGKLPQTVAAMLEQVEATDDFRRRRLDWCMTKAFSSGDLRPCEVLRSAGLPTSWLPTIRDEIAFARIRGASAA